MSKKLVRLVLSICIALVVALGISSSAFAASCSGTLGGEIKLADNLKKILVENTPIPVKSTDLSGIASFRKMIISFNARTSGTLESGDKLNLTDLEDANGYASVVFQVNSGLNKIPAIKNYLESQYSTATDLIKVANVNALLVFLDSEGKELANHAFELKEGANKIFICEFGSIKKDVSSISVKVKSFDGSFSVSHSF